MEDMAGIAASFLRERVGSNMAIDIAIDTEVRIET